MKILRYIFIIVGVLIGIVFTFLEMSEVRLGENLNEPIAYISNKKRFFEFMVVYAAIGGGVAWFLSKIIESLKKLLLEK